MIYTPASERTLMGGKQNLSDLASSRVGKFTVTKVVEWGKFGYETAELCQLDARIQETFSHQLESSSNNIV